MVLHVCMSVCLCVLRPLTDTAGFRSGFNVHGTPLCFDRKRLQEMDTVRLQGYSYQMCINQT